MVTHSHLIVRIPTLHTLHQQRQLSIEMQVQGGDILVVAVVTILWKNQKDQPTLWEVWGDHNNPNKTLSHHHQVKTELIDLNTLTPNHSVHTHQELLEVDMVDTLKIINSHLDHRHLLVPPTPREDQTVHLDRVHQWAK